MRKLLDIGSIFTIVATFALFAIATAIKGFTHELLVEGAVFLVSLKLIIGGAREVRGQKELLARIDSITRRLEGRKVTQGTVNAVILRMENIKKRGQSKNFSKPDEIRPFRSHGDLKLLEFSDGLTIGKATFEPGWAWSNDVKPIAGTKSCEAPHSGYCISGNMKIKMDSGEEFTIHPGDAFQISPGHDAWVEGSEPCVLIDVGGYAAYAKKKAS